MTVAEAFLRLREILDIVGIPLVRERALRSAIGLSRSHFAMLQDIVPTVTADEMTQIVDKLIEIYLEQRANLGKGERRWYHRLTGRYYPIWVSGRIRPLTEVEQEMLAWMQDDRNIVAQQIGVRALAAFVRMLDLAEARHVRSLRRARRPRRAQSPNPDPELRRQKLGMHTVSRYRRYVLPLIAAPFSRRFRSIIHGILPEVLRQYQTNHDIMRFLLYDWRTLDDREIPEIAWRLERAIFWDSALGRWILGGTILLLIFALLVRIVGAYSPFIAGVQLWVGWVSFFSWLCGMFLWRRYDRR
jgi:hypothetical protein